MTNRVFSGEMAVKYSFPRLPFLFPSYAGGMNIPKLLRALDAEIAKLLQVRQLLSDSASTPLSSIELGKRRGRPPGAAKAVKAPAKRTMSEEGRARIAAAQKARWAKSKKAPKAAATPVVAAKKSAVKKTTQASGFPKAAAKKAAAPTKAPAKSTSRRVQKPIAKAPRPVESAAPANTLMPPTPTEKAASEV